MTKISKIHWSFIKVQLFLALTDIQTNTQMHNYIHLMESTSLSKYTKLELCTISLSRASPIQMNKRKLLFLHSQMHLFHTVSGPIQVHYHA